MVNKKSREFMDIDEAMEVRPQKGAIYSRVEAGVQIMLLLIIVVSGAILFMCLVGMIKFADPLLKDQWIEINSQILNSIFTLQAICSLPFRMQCLAWTLKWICLVLSTESVKSASEDSVSVPSPSTLTPCCPITPDITQGASFYSSLIRNEYSDISLVVPDNAQTISQVLEPTANKSWVAIIILLNLQCIFQIPITYAMWVYTDHTLRPFWIVPWYFIFL